MTAAPAPVWIRNEGLLEILGQLADGLVGASLAGRRDLWVRGLLRKPARCAVSERPLQPGELAYRPLCHRSYRTLRIAASVLEEVFDRASTGEMDSLADGRSGRSRPLTQGGNMANNKANDKGGVDVASLEETLMMSLREKLGADTKVGLQRKKSYRRLTIGKTTISYVTPQKASLKVEVPQGKGSYKPMKVTNEKEAREAAAAVAAFAKEKTAAKEPAAA